MNHDEASAGITGVILAGGAARRMGGNDKGLVDVAGRPMIAYTLEALRPQVDSVVINANRNVTRYARFGLPVVTDEMSGFQGPLAGMYSGMRAAVTPLIATVPCDAPFLPRDLVRRLGRALSEAGADIAVAHNGERIQPVFSLLRGVLADSLAQFLARGERKIDKWFTEHSLAIVDFSDSPDAFINVNSPADVMRVETRLLEHGAGRI
jgi:molybdopterin-guanine dinucleotide biosynthesis protein A